eukprot:TRINITY_DN8029_c0_g1_i1.p1 TRINITY_DN8029_c0_g1~~TRINITY_DN8029_c0_g1_i1.p1  ORF type:complete len:255 (-),score=37.38 TRINITY_DN8029_c0_g1_i1:173-937(-)
MSRINGILNNPCTSERFGRRCSWSECPYQHKETAANNPEDSTEKDEEERQSCPYERHVGRCISKTCSYKHKDPNTLPICEDWTRGLCTSWRCSNRHFYTDNDKVHEQCKRFPQDSVSAVLSSFSSPLQVRIITEVTKTRREEIDLETGRKKSWVETSEREVVDITGTTSARKPLGERSNIPRPVRTATTKDATKLAPEVIDLTESPGVEGDNLTTAARRRSSNRSRSRSPRIFSTISSTGVTTKKTTTRTPLLR